MPDYTLYAYFRSSCSARLRIALGLKSISFVTISVNLLKGEQLSAAHLTLNPSASVPVLVSHRTANPRFAIGQSVAALEYLEEVHPDSSPLLPPLSDPQGRAVVRSLVSIIACDTQPVTNMRITRRVQGLGGVAEEWNRELMADGLRAYEKLAAKSAGKYSVGDQITLADVCLMPAVWNAERFGVDVDEFPTVKRVADLLGEHPAVVAAYYYNLPDTPEELRSKK